jgi:cholesterol transport system auxiliary component
MRSVAVSLALVACAGCGSLLETKLPANSSYVLAPAPAASTGVARSDADLSIGRPDLAPGLDSERIAVVKGRELDYYRGAQWGGRTTEVVQTMLVDSFQDQQLFRSVTPEQSRVASEYVLDVSVRDFQAEYANENAAPTAHVTILARLIRVSDRQLVDTFAATAQGRASDNRMTAVAAAFEEAAHKVVLELAQKTAAAISGDAEEVRTAVGEVPSSRP